MDRVVWGPFSTGDGCGVLELSVSNVKVGDKVRVPWGFGNPVVGEIVEVWDDTQAHIRVSLQFEDEEESVILLLTRSAVEAA